MATNSTLPFSDMLSDDEENDPFVALENSIIAYNMAKQKKASAAVDSNDDGNADNAPPSKRPRREVRTSIRFTNIDKHGAAFFSKNNIPAADESPVPNPAIASTQDSLESRVSKKALKYATNAEKPQPAGTSVPETTTVSTGK
jgi:hypothetical protein